MTITKRDLSIVSVLLIPPWALFVLCCYWYFIDVDPPAKHTSVTVLDESGNVVDKIKRGGRLVIARESCVTQNGRAFYTRRLSMQGRSMTYFMPSGEVDLHEGCGKRFNSIQIPSYTEPGIYDYIVTITFANNPLVDTRMILPVPTFEVTP
jgi:hypothetical protein